MIRPVKAAFFRGFWEDNFYVNSDVMEPRPATETLVETAVALFPRSAHLRILDLGTGTGCLLLSLLRVFPWACGFGIDCSPAALAVAGYNARRLGLISRTRLELGDWASGLDIKAHLVVSNPPYLRLGEWVDSSVLRDPRKALYAGKTGQESYRAILEKASKILRPDGYLILELSGPLFSDTLASARSYGWCVRALRRDLENYQRVLVLQYGEAAR